jgi:hypothetical protein
MAYAFNGSNQSISASQTLAIAAPLTIYIRSNHASAKQHYAAVLSNTASNVFLLAPQINNRHYTYTGSGGVFTEATSPTSPLYAVNSWSDLVGQFVSSTSRFAWLDNTKGTEATGSRVPVTINALGIGQIPGASNSNWLNGRAAEMAVWSVSLSDAEINSLWKGFPPKRIRPQSLVFYLPMIRDLHDIRNGLALTNNGSATVFAHPRRYG